MKLPRFSLIRRLIREESGQTIFIVLFTLAGFLALGGLSIEVGHAYYAYHLLQASTNAATLAGASAMPNTTTAGTLVTQYSSVTGNKNASPMLQSVTVTPTYLCLTTVTNTFKTPCITSTGGSGGYNSLSVTQKAQVPLWFGGYLGIHTLNIQATATASMKGGSDSPWNIAVILDTTGSMASSDSGKQCSGTQISCALLGVQALLSDLYPCALGVTCSSSTTTVDSVSLYVFPPILTTSASKDYTCPTSNPTHEYYTVPTLPSTWTYQLPFGTSTTPAPWSTDYLTSDGASSLNSSSDIVKAAGGVSGCNGIGAPGGAGTYYAQAINQAQSDLVTQQKANPGSQNAMIILSDGDATATVTYTTTQTCTGSGRHQTCTTSNTGTDPSSDLQESSADSLNGLTYNNPTSYTYPSAVGECGQAVVAAQAAATAGTAVYTIGYGSETSGCTTDATYSASVTTNGGSWAPGDSPCQALGAMASSPNNFFSDDGNGCVATVPSNAAITLLTQIFHQITGTMTTPRLIPNGTK